MLMNMKELLKVADEKGFAVPAFNIGSDQLLKAVMQQVKEIARVNWPERNDRYGNLVRQNRNQIGMAS